MSRRWRSITPSPWPRSQTRMPWRCGIHAPVSFRKTLRDEMTSQQLANADTALVLDTAAAFLERQADAVSALQQAVSFSTILFWAMAFLVGTVQGGIQAVSRSYFGKLIPKERSNEFFGFFDIFGKFASVLGPFLYSLIGGWTGRSSYGVLCLAVLFLAGLVILGRGREHLDALENTEA